MAKIYDALRKAEADRQRKVGGGAGGERLDWEPETPEPAKPSGSVKLPSGPRDEGRSRPNQDIGDINKRRIALLQPDSYVAEQFRALRGRIDALDSEGNLRSVMVTSAMPGEGKTTAAVNLSVVTGLSLDRSVLLIDCDLRRPNVHQSLGLQPKSGLAEVLDGKVEPDVAITRVEGANLDVLPVRGRPSNPSELLGSPRMVDLMTDLRSRYDRIILDTPAALGLPDAKSVSAFCDGIVVVVRAGRTRQEDTETVIEILGRQRVVGIVLNGAEIDQGRYGYSS
ncbi:MAG: CpsD/CapB family tyrosine-protein kinase [Myxococcales bacterium]|nr:CpsD/CapB family tyrosine-protein kinase [Myxococcales bacterium]